jgi:crossover junction endodeoxyribonuclease RusA
MISFVVPGQPQPKQRPRVVKGHTDTPVETLTAEAKVKACARKAAVKPLLGPVHLTVRAYRSDARRVDLDNLAKLVQDALNGIAYDDDSQIVMLTATKWLDRTNPRTEVEVGPARADWALAWQD